MNKRYSITILFFFLANITFASDIDHSVARKWNEEVLEAIRGDFARPTVHARNLFHTSVAMYDAWAVYGMEAETYLLGKTLHGYKCSMNPFLLPTDIKAAQEEAMSFAVYRLIKHRFAEAPEAEDIFERIDALMTDLGYDARITSTDYACSPAEMGNYIAQHIIGFGFQDGANEINDYANEFYSPVNEPLKVTESGNINLSEFNRWQPLQFNVFIDQSGNEVSDGVPEFLSPEWGQVLPFSLQKEDATIYRRDGFDYWVYHNPGVPPYLNLDSVGGLSEEYKWGFGLVAAWSSHMDSSDGILWDISPASIGNVQDYPTSIEGLRDFYNLEEGGDYGIGWEENPKTGQPYTPQIVPPGDYTRVLAEFWADGPDSETPPGHWYTILNQVNDHPKLEKKIKGEGPILDDLEWDVKVYFALGGAMHDSAIAAWGIKGWYDYLRPVSALRGMAELGQSSDSTLPRYHPGGLTLVPGLIESIQAGDTLEGEGGHAIGQIKFKAWKGPEFITNPFNDVAGVDWIYASEWWPYQRPSFVTPPFAGYVSGHSTYSRAAAELLTAFTGDEFFPGGLGEFPCPMNEFLVFEDGPSVDLTLQWATYRDASDQCSLSRIWGGIHPPADDIPGRLIGERIGVDAFNFAEQYFTKNNTPPNTSVVLIVYPNPTECMVQIQFDYPGVLPINIYQSDGKLLKSVNVDFTQKSFAFSLKDFSPGIYFIQGIDEEGNRLFEEKIIKK